MHDDAMIGKMGTKDKMTEKERLKKLIDTGMGRQQADLCIKNAKVVDVFNLDIFESNIYISDGYIAGFGDDGFPEAKETYDAKGAYIAPGLIDAHVHIESSHLSPCGFSSIVVPHGTTTIIADPHEICNVCGLDGFDYMLETSKNIALNVLFQVPSCVPATPFENAGAELGPGEIAARIGDPGVLGLGELMNYVGACGADSLILDKIMTARSAGKIIDGHSPRVLGKDLDAYTACGVRSDHECTTPEEAVAKIRRGMYVFLREGTLCRDEQTLLPAVRGDAFRFCAFCTDDRQVMSILSEGHIDNNVRIAIQNGIDPVKAVCMGSVNAATCYGLDDRGAVAPGRRADLILLDDLYSFNVKKTWICGKLAASDGKYLAEDIHVSAEVVCGRMNVKGFGRDRLALKLSSDWAKAISLIPDSIITGIENVSVARDSNSCWIRNSEDVVKIAVVERHKGTGNVGLGLLSGLGLKGGAIASTIAHDSHNIIVAGDSDEDMGAAVKCLIEMGGGQVVVKKGKVLAKVCHEIAGLMSDRKAEEMADEMRNAIDLARSELSVSCVKDPFMALCFMALPVIPSLKITDMGLFDVEKFCHISVDAD